MLIAIYQCKYYNTRHILTFDNDLSIPLLFATLKEIYEKGISIDQIFALMFSSIKTFISCNAFCVTKFRVKRNSVTNLCVDTCLENTLNKSNVYLTLSINSIDSILNLYLG